ncbi:MAG: DUF2800 domain-containing protein [Spirochaetales bacterium]|jgi:hypothetical protein|nr:DUF2800 domain-containing protein [Spirochaetales bacterium]
MPPNIHSAFSPSCASRWIPCTASITAEAAIPEKKEVNAPADWGTYAHFISQDLLQNLPPPMDHLGVERFGQVCDQEMVDVALDYFGHIDLLRNEAVNVVEHIEAKVDLGSYGLPEVHGTADYIIDEPFGVLTVVDLKAGKGVQVSPRKNQQGMICALGAGGEWILSYSMVRIIIIQPRTRNGMEVKRVWEITPQDLLSWLEDVLRPAVEAVRNGETSFCPGDYQCKWCRAAGSCDEKAMRDLVNVTAGKPVIVVASNRRKAVEPLASIFL